MLYVNGKSIKEISAMFKYPIRETNAVVKRRKYKNVI